MCCLKCFENNTEKHGEQDKMMRLAKALKWKDDRSGNSITAENLFHPRGEFF